MSDVSRVRMRMKDNRRTSSRCLVLGGDKVEWSMVEMALHMALEAIGTTKIMVTINPGALKNKEAVFFRDETRSSSGIVSVTLRISASFSRSRAHVGCWAISLAIVRRSTQRR